MRAFSNGHFCYIFRWPVTLLADISDWQDFLSAESGLSSELKQKSRTGRPCGTDDFFSTVEGITGHDLRPKLPGRPRNK